MKYAASLDVKFSIIHFLHIVLVLERGVLNELIKLYEIHNIHNCLVLHYSFCSACMLFPQDYRNSSQQITQLSLVDLELCLPTNFSFKADAISLGSPAL